MASGDVLPMGDLGLAEALNLNELKMTEMKPVGKVNPSIPKPKLFGTAGGVVKTEVKTPVPSLAKGNAKSKDAELKASPVNKAEPKPKAVGISEANAETGASKPLPPSKRERKTSEKGKRKREDQWKRQGDNDEQADVVASLNKLTIKEPTPITEFGDMGLNKDVLKAIHNYGLEKPSMCQQNVIVPLIEGRDLICQAQSGMGKTAAFCIAILQKVNIANKTPQVLVLAPTRELAQQIFGVFQDMGRKMGIITVPSIGQGGTFRENKLKLHNGAHIVVATIGRLCHLLSDRDRPLSQTGIKMFVIDEADKMIMDASYNRDMQYIIHQLPRDAQFVVMSATMPTVALMRLEKIMRNPFKFLVKNDQLTLDGIQQFYVNVGTEEHKMNTLSELFPLLNSSRGITFCNTRARATKVSKEMEIRGHLITGMVGTMEQRDRNNTLKNFRDGKILSLVASDLLGRGVDIQHVKLVINFDFPDKTEEYIHRIGRAGRYGRKGIAITFITDSQEEKLKKLEEFYHTKISPMPANVGNLVEMAQ